MKTGFTMIGILLLAFIINHFITFMAITLTTLGIIFLLLGIAFLIAKESKEAIVMIVMAGLILSGVITMPKHHILMSYAVQQYHVKGE